MADDLEHIQAKLNAAGVKVACPMCGSLNHSIDPSAHAAIPARYGDVVNLNRAIGAIAVICEGCGFIRLHKTSIFMRDDDVQG